MDADDLAAIPGAAKGIVGGRYAFGGHRGGGADGRVVQRASFQRPLGGAGANLHRGHRAERDARARDTAAADRQMRSERDHRAAFRLDACDLAIAEGVRVYGALAGDGQHQRAALALAGLQEFFDSHVARAEAALDGDGRIEREQRDGEIAVGVGREQIAAYRAHVAHGRSTDRPGRCVQERKLTLGQDSGEGDAGADGDARTRHIDPRQCPVGRADDGRDRDVAFIEGAHDKRAAAEIARAAVGRQCRGRLAETRKCPHRDGHGCASAFMRPPSSAGE